MDETNAKIPDPEQVPFMDLWPDVGKGVFGWKRTATYAAAQRGDIETVRIGRHTYVPTASLRRMFGLNVEGGDAA